MSLDLSLSNKSWHHTVIIVGAGMKMTLILNSNVSDMRHFKRHFEDDFYRSDNPTNSVKALKEAILTSKCIKSSFLLT